MYDSGAEFNELMDILSLASKSWPAFGLSAIDISEMDQYTRQLVRIAING